MLGGVKSERTNGHIAELPSIVLDHPFRPSPLLADAVRGQNTALAKSLDPIAETDESPREIPLGADAAFDWAAYVDFVVEREGSLTAAADRLAGARAYKDDVGSVERALRRLRHKGTGDGGRWGTRALATFGMPDEIMRRLRWMAVYHSRFTDLPVPIAADLVRAWDRPPVNGSRSARTWIALAHASIALRRADLAGALDHVGGARADLASAPATARLEALFVQAYVASRLSPSDVGDLLAEAEQLLPEVADAEEQSSLAARLADHHGYALGRASPPDHAGAEAVYRALPEADATPFVCARRASGLAHALWKQGRTDEAAALARAAVSHAGDGGHVRLRAMALSLLARIAGGDEGERAHARAVAISARLLDETLRIRLTGRSAR